MALQWPSTRPPPAAGKIMRRAGGGVLASSAWGCLLHEQPQCGGLALRPPCWFFMVRAPSCGLLLFKQALTGCAWKGVYLTGASVAPRREKSPSPKPGRRAARGRWLALHVSGHGRNHRGGGGQSHPGHFLRAGRGGGSGHGAQGGPWDSVPNSHGPLHGRAVARRRFRRWRT